MRARAGRELDEEAADAAGRSDHQHGLAAGRRQRVARGEGGEPRERRGSGALQCRCWRGFGGDEVVLGDGDQLGPAAVVDVRVREGEEAVDLVADR